MRTLLGLVMFVLLGAAQAQDSYLSHASAINKAGRQRMLSQRIVKCYLQIAEGVTPGLARGQLSEAILVFDDQLADLKAFASTPEVRKSVEDVAQQWFSVRELATGPVSREGASALRAAAERLLQAAEGNTAALEGAASLTHGRLVNLAGRQRMLSQRIAKAYLLLAMRFDRAGVRAELDAARGEFGRVLEELRAAPENDAGARLELAAVDELWRKLQPRLVRDPDPGMHSRDIAERASIVAAADAILNRMDRVTAIYEEFASSRR